MTRRLENNLFSSLFFHTFYLNILLSCYVLLDRLLKKDLGTMKPICYFRFTWMEPYWTTPLLWKLKRNSFLPQMFFKYFDRWIEMIYNFLVNSIHSDLEAGLLCSSIFTCGLISYFDMHQMYCVLCPLMKNAAAALCRAETYAQSWPFICTQWCQTW